MPNYRIVGSYQIKDTEPNPDVVLAPQAGNLSAYYTFSVAGADELAALVIANAEAKAAGSGSSAATDQAVLDQVDNLPECPPEAPPPPPPES